jgi:hypothetical protein
MAANQLLDHVVSLTAAVDIVSTWDHKGGASHSWNNGRKDSCHTRGSDADTGRHHNHSVVQSDWSAMRGGRAHATRTFLPMANTTATPVARLRGTGLVGVRTGLAIVVQVALASVLAVGIVLLVAGHDRGGGQ